MQEALLISQIVLGVILSGVILLQVKGKGFGRVWGGLSTSSSKRGLEGLIFKATFVLSFGFILISTLLLVL